MTNTTHAKLSPSGSKRWMTCPGSVRFADAVGSKDRTSKYAAEGTAAHELGERCLANGTHPADYKGETIVVDGMSFKVNKNMIEAVEEYVAYVRDTITFCGGKPKLELEVRCCLKSLGIPGLDGGTSDTMITDYDNTTLYVVDYKHGAGVAVEVQNNPQLMQYGGGAMIKEAIKAGWKVVLVIVQPRAFHADGGIREWEITSEELWEWINTALLPAAEATKDPEAPLVPSDDGCRWCPAGGECNTLYDRTQELAVIDFASEADIMPDPNQMTAEQKANIVTHANVIRAFILKVEEQVRNEANEGSKLYAGTLKLVRKQSRRKLTEDALDEFTSPLFDHLSEEEIYDKKAVAMGEIEKRLKKKVGKKIADVVMAEITTKPEGDLVIAPVGDKRTEAQPTMITDFDEFKD